MFRSLYYDFPYILSFILIILIYNLDKTTTVGIYFYNLSSILLMITVVGGILYPLLCNQVPYKNYKFQ
jgi:hypothetical protein